MKGKGLIISFAIVLILALIGYFIYLNNSGNKFNWRESYKANNKEPYGAYIFAQLLSSYFPNNHFKINKKSYIKVGLPYSKKGFSNFIFLGQQMYLNDKNADSLINWIKQGNTALIISSKIPYKIDSLFKLKSNFPDEWMNDYEIKDSVINSNFYNKDLKTSNGYGFHYQYAEQKQEYYWNHFNGDQFGKEIEPLGYINNGFVNYCKIDIGKGKILLHKNPLFFTNYHLIQKERAEYVSKVLSYLKEGDIILDQYALNWNFNQNNQHQGKGTGNSPLSFILNNEALRWAWYTFVILIILYLIFGIKRQQKAIRVIEPLNNSSLEFVNTIGRLHFLQKNHPSLIKHQMRFLMMYIKEKYRINATELNAETIELLSKKSGVNKNDLQEIQDKYIILRNYVELEDNQAIEFYKLINKFFNHIKK
jgi:hypothetical protein